MRDANAAQTGSTTVPDASGICLETGGITLYSILDSLYRQSEQMMLSSPVTLSDTKFFLPNSKFGAFMSAQFDGRLIYDVGAGVGHVAKELTERGLKVIAIDIIRRQDTEFNVEMVPGSACGYRRGSVVMLCRPCHGSFIEMVFRQAVMCKAGTLVYVGKQSNVAGDLGGWRYRGKNPARIQFKKMLSNAGKDGEHVWVANLPLFGQTPVAAPGNV
jgi:hypothetical protein